MSSLIRSDVGNDALTNNVITFFTVTQIKLFNKQVRNAFYYMLNARKDESHKQITIFEKRRVIKWLTDFFPERLNLQTDKKRS